MSDRKPAITATTGLAGVGIGAFAIVCCAGSVAVLGAVGGITVGGLIGGLAGLAIIAGSAIAFVVIRRRRSCDPSAKSTGDAVPGADTAASGVPAQR